MRSTAKISIHAVGLWVMLLLLAPFHLSAQEFVPGLNTRHLKVVTDLNSVWLDTDFHFHNVPQWNAGTSPQVLSRNFVFQSNKVPDEARMFILFEGIAWTSRIYLNEKFLGTTDDPFSPALFQVRKEWLNQDPNVLRVEMSGEGPSKLLYPQKFTGIYRPVWLMVETSTARMDYPNPVYSGTAERALVLAPWSESTGPLTDTAGFTRMLKDLKAAGQKEIYFPFPPATWQLKAVEKEKIRVLQSMDFAKEIAFYNYYPMERSSNPFSTPFWTQLGAHNPGYGKFFSREFLQSPLANPPDNFALFVFFALPVVFLVLLRLLSIRIYDSLPQFLIKPNIYMELITGSNYLGQWETKFMNLFRLVLSAVLSALFLYFISLNRQYDSLNIFSGQSILHAFLTSADRNLFVLFLFSLGFLFLLDLVRNFILGGISRIYGYHGVNQEMTGLDIFASFPLNVLPVFPALLLFFTNGWLLESVKVLLFILVGIYYLRKLWVVYFGLNRVLGVSASVKILYICTFEILPWIILV